MRCLIATCFFLFGISCFSAEFKLPDALPDHPRLFLTKKRETEIREQVKTDAFLDRIVKELVKKADRAKSQPVTDYQIPDGKRLLGQSRRSIDRTTALAFAYRMTGKTEYAEAAIDEMLAVCRFKDWNPSHYLDTAEMATAVGIGYDWLYDVIPSDKRTEIRAGIVKHALGTGKPLYEKGGWWVKGHNNWNEVCNAGLTIGALAVAEDHRELAEMIVGHAIKSLPSGLSAYKPDGAYPEGPGYWAYGASFTGLMLKVLDDVFQDDFGLLETPGLRVTGDYYMGVVGPDDRFYNYADGGDGADSSPMMFALSGFYGRPDYAVWLRDFLERKNRFQSGRLAVFHAVWYNPAGTSADFAKTPRAKMYRGIQDICTMRTAWGDPQAAFLGFKAGNNRANHGHLDVGSFVYEVGGVRWAVDLGTDDYNLPGYFGKQRWDYYRLNNRSHNTLVIGDKLQNPAADCKLISFETDGETFVARAVADMTAAYKDQVASAKRTATLFNDGSVVIEDELEGVTETVRWGMMTQATVAFPVSVPEIKESEPLHSALLSQKDAALLATITGTGHPKFETVSVKPATEKERQNQGFSMLAAFVKPDENGKVQIRVTLRSVE